MTNEIFKALSCLIGSNCLVSTPETFFIGLKGWSKDSSSGYTTLNIQEEGYDLDNITQPGVYQINCNNVNLGFMIVSLGQYTDSTSIMSIFIIGTLVVTNGVLKSINTNNIINATKSSRSSIWTIKNITSALDIAESKEILNLKNYGYVKTILVDSNGVTNINFVTPHIETAILEHEGRYLIGSIIYYNDVAGGPFAVIKGSAVLTSEGDINTNTGGISSGDKYLKIDGVWNRIN